ncbi:MAG: hypothetical protein IJ306_08255 [Oscillospiraceae bacterium]|nr:hypothetical protein [Oscillospiraceae bacterium]
MKKLLAIFFAALMLASCGKEPPAGQNNDIIPPENEISVSEDSEPEEEKEPWYVKFSDVEIPEFPDADTTKLPTDRNNFWNTDGPGFFTDTAIKQYFCDHEEAMEIAEKIYLAEGYHISGYHEREYFDDITKADNEYLLYSAVRLAPFIETGMMSYHYNSTGTENADNIVAKALEYFYAETGFEVIEAYYADDVEYIFHYLFGTKAEYNPEDIELYGYHPYVPSAGIFLNFFESTPPAAVPQIVSIEEKDGKYYAEVVWTDVFDYVTEDYTPEEFIAGPNKSKILVLAEGIEPESLLKVKKITYILEKENGYGRFYISGITE